MSFLVASFSVSPCISVILVSPGRTIFHVLCAANKRRSWCWISSCNLGTLASFARLPIREVVLMSS